MSRTNQIVARLPGFYRSGDTANLFYSVVEVYARLLEQAEEDLLRVQKTHWVKTADNEGSRGFDALEKGDLDKILTLWLESLGATELLKQGKRRSGAEGWADDELYRRRILGVIQVLLRGAATLEGVTAVTAANLGVLPDLPYAALARARGIRIVEFLPETIAAGGGLAPIDVVLSTDFRLENDSPVPVTPEFRLHFREDMPLPLSNPRIVHPASGQSVRFPGTVKPADDLFFLSDNKGLLEGSPFAPEGGLVLLPGASDLRLDAEMGFPQGFFDEAFFDYAQFERASFLSTGRFGPSPGPGQSNFDESFFAHTTPVATLQVLYRRLLPGSFTVHIDWDIPGFSVDILIQERTLARLAVFGAAESFRQKVAPLVGKTFGTLPDFYAALAPLIVSEPVGILLSRLILADPDALPGLPRALAAKMLGLIPTGDETLRFATLEALETALSVLSEAETAALRQSLGYFLEAGSPLLLLLRECWFSDKFTRFDINPRGQIEAIIERVKAAGVYSAIAFEKRFWENQQLAETPGMTATFSETHPLTENDFDFASIHTPDPAGISHELGEAFRLEGIFDYTTFDSLNGFA